MGSLVLERLRPPDYTYKLLKLAQCWNRRYWIIQYIQVHAYNELYNIKRSLLNIECGTGSSIFHCDKWPRVSIDLRSHVWVISSVGQIWVICSKEVVLGKHGVHALGRLADWQIVGNLSYTTVSQYKNIICLVRRKSVRLTTILILIVTAIQLSSNLPSFSEIWLKTTPIRRVYASSRSNAKIWWQI